jgi:hypothetical protein
MVVTKGIGRVYLGMRSATASCRISGRPQTDQCRGPVGDPEEVDHTGNA